MTSFPVRSTLQEKKNITTDHVSHVKKKSFNNQQMHIGEQKSIEGQIRRYKILLQHSSIVSRNQIPLLHVYVHLYIGIWGK